MKSITLSLLFFSLIAIPVVAGESEATPNHENKSLFARYKKSIIVGTALTAAGAAWVYAGKPGYDDTCEMLGYMYYSDTASNASNAMGDACNTVTDYALRAWNSPFTYALGDISDMLQDKLIRYSQRIWHSSTMQSFRSKVNDMYQDISTADDNNTSDCNTADQNKLIEEAFQQVQESCPRESFINR